MSVLRLLLLVGLASPALAVPPQVPEDRDEAILSIAEDGTLYQLTPRGEEVLLEDFGPSPGGLLSGEVRELTLAPVDSFRIPTEQIQRLVGSMANYKPPTGQKGLILDEGMFWVQYEQGLPIWWAVAAIAGLLAAGGLGVGLVLTRRERRRRAVEALARQRALHAREAERTRIARELHDGPLQDVHALRLLGVAGGDEGVGEEAGRIAKELRAIAEGLRPPALGRFGLAAALSAHANRVKDRHPDVVIGLDLDEDGTGAEALPDVARAALFRIAQEAITNAIEHGGAGRLRIALRLPDLGAAAPGPIVLEVTDDGSGMTGPLDLEALADGGHFGLVGMHERAEAIGGRLTISNDGIGGAGARVRAVLPDVRATAPRRRWAAAPRRLLSPPSPA